MQSSIEELNSFEEYAISTCISEPELFRRIAVLDEAYKNNIEYEININGVICNIASSLGYLKVLTYAARRLNATIKTSNDDKYLYDLGNTILCIAEIETPYPHSITYLLESSRFSEAKRYFERISKEHDYFPYAITNTANILEKYGRTLEAISLYDEVITKFPNFGMALCNKAQAIEYYVKQAPSVSLRLVDIARSLYKQGLNDPRLETIGGPRAYSHFENNMSHLNELLKNNNYKGPSDENRPVELNEYLAYCLDSNLFLNHDFGYYYDKESVRDNFFPSFIECMQEKQNKRTGVMSERIYFSFHVFNQILESYSSSRAQFYNALSTNYEEYDKLVRYTYTLDYTQHSHKYGLLKSTLGALYSCLDKVAHLMHYYYIAYDESGEKNIYFNWLLTEEFRGVAIKEDNYQLLALWSLAKDFEPNHKYSYLRTIRNRITHSFININTEILYDENARAYEITESMLIDAIERMFLIVKSALMYSVNALAKQKVDGKTVPMNTTFESEIFH
jgi:hypothetical protein